MSAADRQEQSRMIAYIMKNQGNLNEVTQKELLRRVIFDVCDGDLNSPVLPTVITQSGQSKESNVDLNRCSELSPGTIKQMYNIVLARMQVLDRPVGMTVSPWESEQKSKTAEKIIAQPPAPTDGAKPTAAKPTAPKPTTAAPTIKKPTAVKAKIAVREQT